MRVKTEKESDGEIFIELCERNGKPVIMVRAFHWGNDCFDSFEVNLISLLGEFKGRNHKNRDAVNFVIAEIFKKLQKIA